MFLNKVQLIGNLTRDPELKSLPSGVKVCAFSVATNEVYTKDGQKIEKAEFHNIVVFGRVAENVAKFLRKGSQVYVEGKLQTRSWEAEGVKRYRTEIIALNVQFGSKPKGEGNQSQTDHYDDAPDTNDASQYPAEGSDINPEDIPF